MKRYLLIIPFLLPLSLYAEKSAFGAGDLSSPSPYGLTKTEKYILKNKETINNMKASVLKNKMKITDVEDSLFGIKSIVEGLSEKGRKDKLAFQELKNSISGLKESSDELGKKVDVIIIKNDENIKQLKTAMTALSSIIDTINSSYVTKDEYDSLAKQINDFKLDVSKQLKRIAAGVNSPFENKSNAQVAKDAKELFNKKRYADAIDAYEYLIKKSYKPAAAHYYIGESYFHLDEYLNAVAYFKESAKRYSKASYMPKLMLHTAISLKKSDDKEGAQQFFQALIAKYPNSAEAEKAKKFLK